MFTTRKLKIHLNIFENELGAIETFGFKQSFNPVFLESFVIVNKSHDQKTTTSANSRSWHGVDGEDKSDGNGFRFPICGNFIRPSKEPIQITQIFFVASICAVFKNN